MACDAGALLVPKPDATAEVEPLRSSTTSSAEVAAPTHTVPARELPGALFKEHPGACAGAGLSDVVRIRSASATDSDFLQRMLVVAADWRPGAPVRPVAAVLADPALAHYVEGWPRHDDFGVIAEDSRGEPLGAAWCRYFSAEDPGYGFVSPDVPELSIGVVAGARGAGVGRTLLVNLFDEARTRGISQLSLSVEIDNYARHLYSSLGFMVTREGDGSATMVLTID